MLMLTAWFFCISVSLCKLAASGQHSVQWLALGYVFLLLTVSVSHVRCLIQKDLMFSVGHTTACVFSAFSSLL